MGFLDAIKLFHDKAMVKLPRPERVDFAGQTLCSSLSALEVLSGQPRTPGGVHYARELLAQVGACAFILFDSFEEREEPQKCDSQKK